MGLRIGVLLCCGMTSLWASLPHEAVPWTKSFLETKIGTSAERYSLSTNGHRYARSFHTQYDGSFFVSSAPIVDWEFDAAVFGRSLPTRKLFIRAETQLLSDLERSPVAVTAVVDISHSGHERSRQPIFFEMAKSGAEAGLGVGKHLLIKKAAYTQLFSYLIGGAGMSGARWTRVEMGLQQVFFSRHTIRLSYEWLKTFGHREQFFGMGTIRTLCHNINALYSYKFSNGLEARCSFARCLIHRRGLESSSQLQLSLSFPFSLG